MDRLCHRCGTELGAATGESSFCPHCGAPQLRVLEENVTAAGRVTGDTGESTGAAPPPHPERVHWAAVVGCAALVALVATALMTAVFWLPGVLPVAWLWTVFGAVAVLPLYRKRHPETPVTAKLGARFGLVYGLLTVSALALLVAVAGLAARFELHRMAAVDTWLSSLMQQAVQQQMQGGGGGVSAEQLRVFFSPEVRAGMALFLLTVAGLFLVAFSTLGGAIGGMMRPRRR